jgi:ribosomal protein L37E
MPEEWICQKCGGKRFKVLMTQTISQVFDRNENAKPATWDYTDATIEDQDIILIKCTVCGEIAYKKENNLMSTLAAEIVPF